MVENVTIMVREISNTWEGCEILSCGTDEKRLANWEYGNTLSAWPRISDDLWVQETGRLCQTLEEISVTIPTAEKNDKIRCLKTIRANKSIIVDSDAGIVLSRTESYDYSAMSAEKWEAFPVSVFLPPWDLF